MSLKIAIICAITIATQPATNGTGIANYQTHVITMSPEAYNSDTNPHSLCKPAIQDVARFWSKVDLNGPMPDQSIEQYQGLGNCWEWTAHIMKETGYGMIRCKGKTWLTHRFSALLMDGALHEGKCVLHLCDNRKCVRHLRQGTYKDNTDDCISKDRMAVGTDLPVAKLTDETAAEMREMYSQGNLSKQKLGKMFGISRRSAADCINRITWKHI